MDVPADEARRALEQINRVTEQAKMRIGMGPAGWVIMLWGVIWMVCFGVPYWNLSISGSIWLYGNAIGFIATGLMFWRDYIKREVVSQELNQLGKRIGLAWMTLSFFTFGGFMVMNSFTGAQLGTIIVILIMFMYVIIGLWLNAKSLVVTGWVVSAFAVSGYLFAKWGWLGEFRVLMLWLSVFCGGPLFLCGLYIKLRWK
ncbi:hypothetical protein [Poriferisphaera corsica]|nr:hypothetical protein [Poriferisphaera corsica]